MRSGHLSSADLALAAESGRLDDGARLHLEGCSRCRARYESAAHAYRSIGGALRSGPQRWRREETGHRHRAPAMRYFDVLLAREDADAAALLQESSAYAGHLSDDRLLALATEAASPDDARDWRRHLEDCGDCRRRAAMLDGYVERRPSLGAAEVAAARALVPPPAMRRARLEITRLPDQPGLLLSLRIEGSSALADRRPEVVLPCRGALLHLFAAVDASGAARLDVDVESRGAPPEGVAVSLRGASGRTADARTGRLGRATLPLEAGRSVLTAGTAPVWEVEIDL